MIKEDVLLAYGGTFRKYRKGQCIFFEGEKSLFYHQVVEGSVRMINVFETGKEFIQGIFKAGESFGEPVVLVDYPYPATAVANEDTLLLKIKKENFLSLLHDNNDILFKLTQLLSERLHRKAIISREIAGETPQHRVAMLLSLFKKESGCRENEKFKVALQRQIIADMVGLRVETVIRIMKKLEQQGTVSIKKGKVYV